MLPDGYALRPLSIDDAAALAAAAARNREHLRPWEPARPESFFTEEGQREVVAGRLRQVELGLYDCWLLWHGDDVVGAANLQNIVRGAMHGRRRGLLGRPRPPAPRPGRRRARAPRAARPRPRPAPPRGQHDGGERRRPSGVLRRCGFEECGRIPAFLYLDGDWRDSLLFNLVLHDGPPRG